jgi:hypothetical protein
MSPLFNPLSGKSDGNADQWKGLGWSCFSSCCGTPSRFCEAVDDAMSDRGHRGGVKTDRSGASSHAA